MFQSWNPENILTYHFDNDDDDDDDDEDDEKDPDLTATMRAQVAQPEEVATVFIATVIH